MNEELYFWSMGFGILLIIILFLIFIVILGRRFKRFKPEIYLHSSLILFFILSLYFHSKFLIVPTIGPSMLPNIKNNNYILAVDYYKNNKINYGDVVAIDPHIKIDGVGIIKRVVGLSGDTVEIKNDYLFLNDKVIKQERDGQFIYDNKTYEQNTENIKENISYKILNYAFNRPEDYTAQIKVDEEHYFVLGDNRDNSMDSRDFGPFHKSLIRHKVLFIEPHIFEKVFFKLLDTYDLLEVIKDKKN